MPSWQVTVFGVNHAPPLSQSNVSTDVILSDDAIAVLDYKGVEKYKVHRNFNHFIECRKSQLEADLQFLARGYNVSWMITGSGSTGVGDILTGDDGLLIKAFQTIFKFVEMTKMEFAASNFVITAKAIQFRNESVSDLMSSNTEIFPIEDRDGFNISGLTTTNIRSLFEADNFCKQVHSTRVGRQDSYRHELQVDPMHFGRFTHEAFIIDLEQYIKRGVTGVDSMRQTHQNPENNDYTDYRKLSSRLLIYKTAGTECFAKQPDNKVDQIRKANSKEFRSMFHLKEAALAWRSDSPAFKLLPSSLSTRLMHDLLAQGSVIGSVVACFRHGEPELTKATMELAASLGRLTTNPVAHTELTSNLIRAMRLNALVNLELGREEGLRGIEGGNSVSTMEGMKEELARVHARAIKEELARVRKEEEGAFLEGRIEELKAKLSVVLSEQERLQGELVETEHLKRKSEDVNTLLREENARLLSELDASRKVAKDALNGLSEEARGVGLRLEASKEALDKSNKGLIDAQVKIEELSDDNSNLRKQALSARSALAEEVRIREKLMSMLDNDSQVLVDTVRDVNENKKIIDELNQKAENERKEALEKLAAFMVRLDDCERDRETALRRVELLQAELDLRDAEVNENVKVTEQSLHARDIETKQKLIEMHSQMIENQKMAAMDVQSKAQAIISKMLDEKESLKKEIFSLKSVHSLDLVSAVDRTRLECKNHHDLHVDIIIKKNHIDIEKLQKELDEIRLQKKSAFEQKNADIEATKMEMEDLYAKEFTKHQAIVDTLESTIKNLMYQLEKKSEKAAEELSNLENNLLDRLHDIEEESTRTKLPIEDQLKLTKQMLDNTQNELRIVTFDFEKLSMHHEDFSGKWERSWKQAMKKEFVEKKDLLQDVVNQYEAKISNFKSAIDELSSFQSDVNELENKIAALEAEKTFLYASIKRLEADLALAKEKSNLNSNSTSGGSRKGGLRSAEEVDRLRNEMKALKMGMGKSEVEMTLRLGYLEGMVKKQELEWSKIYVRMVNAETELEAFKSALSLQFENQINPINENQIKPSTPNMVMDHENSAQNIIYERSGISQQKLSNWVN